MHHLFEERCDTLRAQGCSDRVAVDAGDVVLTYDDVDVRANRLARYLLATGVRPGDRLALLLDDPVHSYVGMLATLKAGAVYVPVDPACPLDRLGFIAEDAGVGMVLSLSHLRDRLEGVEAPVLCLDETASTVARERGTRLTDAERGGTPGDLCYVIYTSGSTGRPKGVAVGHASICNFVKVALECYGLEPSDRVYQGMTIAFDFSVEEIWLPLVTGATLVPKPAGTTLVGHELRDFLASRDVTALCCVPTLLATLDENLPALRFLLVSGEACPQYLVARWYRHGRRFLNVYGPTEATVTATWTPLHPDRPVTLGRPLPTYSVLILDPAADRALPYGETGEIGLAGIGLAEGYVNRDDLTDRAFIPDFCGIANNPSGRIYRTGDLGRVTEDGVVEYHGRIDTQVKLRGYRVELSEIESTLLELPGIAQAVVSTYEPEPSAPELVAYVTRRDDAPRLDHSHVYAHLRERLPGYMVPAYVEEVAAIPRLPSDKVDRKRLPSPGGPRLLASQNGHLEPANTLERALAGALADVLRLDRVSVNSHFFDDLGANSLLMAHFCARLRERTDLSPVSMKDVYLHPTVRGLAEALGELAPPGQEPRATPELARTTTAQYLLCGVAQMLVFLVSTTVAVHVLVAGFEWVSRADGLGDVYVRALLYGSGSFVVLSAAPILAKWLLVGRWTAREIRVWSLAYLRFWIVKTLIRGSPLRLFVGSPLYSLYLRALGARVGRGVVVLSPTVPVCTDLLTIGDGTVVRNDSSFTCYRAEAGVIRTGAVTLGRDVFVGEKTVLDIGTSIGDGAQLGHASSLHVSQAVPAGESWHGCPAQPAGVDYRRVDPRPCGPLRRAAYATGQLAVLLAVSVPAGFGVGVTLLTEIPLLADLFGAGELAFTSPSFYLNTLAVSLVLFVGTVLTGLAVTLTVPRLLHRLLQPGRVYPLFGIHFWLQRAVARMTNVAFYTDLFGDSSYIVHYLRALGYDLSRVVQTGSNFGTEIRHESPYLCHVGSGTMVSDALTFMNIEVSSTSFRVAPVRIGEGNFLGNNIAFPPDARTGNDCMLGTKVMIPVDGEVREGTGLLGSPPFEIPRTVDRDRVFEEIETGEEGGRRLAAKNRYNIATMGLFLLVRWFLVFLLLVVGGITVHVYDGLGAVAVTLGTVTALVLGLGYSVLVERALLRFGALRPRFCSIYDPYFWWHERLWKLGGSTAFDGTPFRNVLWRLLGVRIGRGVFDDGCDIPEKTLVAIGDDCTLNAGSVIQCHSLEDGTFKSDCTALGTGCTLGVESFVHYGVRMAPGSVLDADSFLMKGEETPPRTRWRGNPARDITGAAGSGPAVPAQAGDVPRQVRRVGV